jgi:hypothetical protein
MKIEFVNKYVKEVAQLNRNQRSEISTLKLDNRSELKEVVSPSL